MPTIYDNKEKILAKGINEALVTAKRADFCIGYFYLSGWNEIAEQIDGLSGGNIFEGSGNNQTEFKRYCRLLVGMPSTPLETIREHYRLNEDFQIDQGVAVKLKKRIAEDFKNQLTIGSPTASAENALKKLNRQMKEGKVVVKLHLRYQLHAKLYIAHLDSSTHLKTEGFVGSSNLTFSGLVKQGELNVDVLEQDAAEKLSKWFDERWNDRWCFDITKELIEIIDNSWAKDDLISPYYIYLKIAYHLAREARAGINNFNLPKIFQKNLLDFQQKAVLVAAHHLNKRGGVMIGDVVGLGKTMIATALAKLFEEDFLYETLIICPKNLTSMWEEYAIKYHLIHKIVPQSIVTKELPDLRRYRVVIIDESHNYRNDQGSHYRAIKAYLETNESKVILLTATPYNKNYKDLSNQLRLFIPDDKDLGISPEHYIQSIGGQAYFSAEHTDTFIRSIKAFEKSEIPDDWRELMRLYLVRRTRSFIKNHYAKKDDDNDRKYLLFHDGTRSYFPDRLPKKVEYEFNSNDPNDIYAQLYSDDVVHDINSLNLPRYGLQKYLDNKTNLKPTADETKVFDNMTRAGRRLMGFCRTSLFKRLESSGYAFLLSLSRHILRNYIFIYALVNDLPLPIGKRITIDLDEFIEDTDLENEDNLSKIDNTLNLILNAETYLKKGEEVYNLFTGDNHKNRFDWVRKDFFTDNLKKDLIDDSTAILEILDIGKSWKAENDKQLNALEKLISKTHKNDKILVFTQFADTAYYLEKELKKRNIPNLVSVSGSDENPTEKARRFSPISNNVKNITDEIRILISTDVLSEGQNLQDSHIVVNYDLPWAIIRLIQRAGRVDRIGQQSHEILCYSFLPEDGIEKIINLRRRLSNRIKNNAEVVGSDETFFDGDPINIADLYNEKAGIIDGDEDDSDVDLASYAFQIWKEATEGNNKLRKTIEDLENNIYSTRKLIDNGEEKEGVIVYVKTADDTDMLSYIDNKGKLITQSQLKILKTAFCTDKTESLQRMEKHHEIVTKGIKLAHEAEKNTGGSLGKRSSIKYQVFSRLERYCKENEDTPLLISNTLKKAIDDVFNYSLTEMAKDTISRQLKAGVSDEQVADIVLSLHDEDRLVISSKEQNNDHIPQIICSLGIKGNE